VRVRSPDDRRKILIELTPKNEAIHGLYEEVSAKMADVFYAGITSGEIVEFERTLQRISDNLNRFESDRAG
jgi:MarR family transcriptional regulator, organic hydroperoxide resistance regulator